MEGRDGSCVLAVDEREVFFVVRKFESGLHFLPSESMAAAAAPQAKRNESAIFVWE